MSEQMRFLCDCIMHCAWPFLYVTACIVYWPHHTVALVVKKLVTCVTQLYVNKQ
uniref:Uncharacterized protein n=1 Tax=Arundo donax TaxID=35708 RepID=A0A0A9EVD3_ARUDO